MTAVQYRKIETWFRSRPFAYRLLKLLNRGLPRLVYLIYPAAALFLFFHHDPRLLRYLVVPAIAFLGCTVVRHQLNCPRPYEVWDIQPLIVKDKAGHSFPSRHMTSVAVIAMAFWYLWPPVGILLTAIAVVMAVVRVLAGIHFTKDVLAGGIIGFAIGYIGFFWIP